MTNHLNLSDTSSMCSDMPRPLYEQTLLSHLDDLLSYLQYDCITNEEYIKVYNAAIAIIFMFLNNNRQVPTHHIEWLIELCNNLIEMR